MDQTLTENLETPVKDTELIPANQTAICDLTSGDNFDDIFGDLLLPSRPVVDPNTPKVFHERELLFDSHTADDEAGNHEDISTLANLAKSKTEEHDGTAGSLFDDLLDFSSPKTSDLVDVSSVRPSELDRMVEENVIDLKPVADVDLLLGVDTDLVSPTSLQSAAKVNNPDILDFFEAPSDVSGVSSMDITESLTGEPLSDSWTIVMSSDASSDSHGKEKSPDIVVTAPDLVVSSDLDTDSIDGKVSKKDDGEKDEKTDVNINEKKAAKTEEADKKTDTKNSSYQEDFNFSVLELPESSTLNFDHVKHKRNISQKGSIANRKKPKRATIQPTSEDSIFLDSTEPKPQKPDNHDEQDGELRPPDNKAEKTKEPETELSEETSPSRKPAGGVKIPGLLEGLSKSKVFNRSEKKSPVNEPDKTDVALSDKADKLQSVSPTESPPEISSTSPAVRLKPVVLPRVHPKPTSKTLKDTQNHTTASGGVVRASSFRTAGSNPGDAEQPSLLKSPSALSRSASVKVTSASFNKDLEQRDKMNPPFSVPKLLPPKPELQNTPSAVAPKLAEKTPPPVASKPAVPARTSRTGLGLSASFTGGKSPLFPVHKFEAKTDRTNAANDLTDSGKIVNIEKNTTTIKHSSATEITVTNDNKMLKSYVGSDMKSPALNSESQSISTTQDKIELGSSKTSFGESEKPKIFTVSRIPSLRKSLPTGFIGKTGFKSEDCSTNIERKSDDAGDVFDTSTISAAYETTASPNIPDSTRNPGDSFGSTKTVDEILQPPRKLSFSGITPVKSPLANERPAPSAAPRKGSISGSAYNPIGFRSTLGSSDSDQRSRASSVSSSHEGVVSVTVVNPVSSVVSSGPKPRSDSNSSYEDQRSRDGSFGNVAIEQVSDSLDKPLDSVPSKTRDTPSAPPAAKFTASFLSKVSDDNRNDSVRETSKDVQGSRNFRVSIPSSALNGNTSIVKPEGGLEKKPSPWNIQLKKVDKKESPKPEPMHKTEESQPVNWRQQLSSRQKNSVAPKEAEKPKQDSTPDWAKASIKRRQRLIESGVIRGDS